MTPAMGYAQMKDSGIPWAEQIPATWKVERGKAILTLLQRPVLDDDEIITCFRDGEVTLRKNRREDGFTTALKEIGYQGIEAGDFVVHGMDGFAGAIGISDSRGKASPVLNVMDSTQNKQFLVYYLRALAYRDVFMALSTGIRVRSCDLRWNKLANLPYILPPLEEQVIIVEYLNTKCAKIDEIIDEAKTSIENLKTYKFSVISKTTFDQEWPVLSLRHCIQGIEQGWSSPPAEMVDDENGWSVLTLSAVKHGEFYAQARKPIDANAKIPENLELRMGDFLMTRSNTRELVGDVCVVDNNTQHTIFSDLIYRITFNEKLLPQYAK